MISLRTVGLLIIQDGRLLLAYSKNKNCFYLPGGKVDPGETPESALCREIAEELNVNLEEQDYQYYTHISAPAFGEEENVIMEQDCYLLTRSVDPQASAEIGEIRYFSLGEYKKEEAQAPGVIAILTHLMKHGLVV